MAEQKRDAAADLAMCERATPGPWVYEKGELVTHNPDDQWRGGLVAKIDSEWIADGDKHFIPESREALPHWIKRATEAEAEVERLRRETETIRYVVDFLDPGDFQQRRARLHLLEVIKRLNKA
jgi:hypothetical protein